MSKNTPTVLPKTPRQAVKEKKAKLKMEQMYPNYAKKLGYEEVPLKRQLEAKLKGRRGLLEEEVHPKILERVGEKKPSKKSKAANMKDGGEAKRTLEITQDIIKAGRELKNSGTRLKPQRPIKIFPSAEQRRKMQDIEFIRDGIEMIPVTKKENGGAVPKKYKGFSKLPERVQQKINPDLAGKYEDGGEVRGMGRAYQGKPRGCKIR